MRVVNADTLVIELKRPFAPLPSLLASVGGLIVDPAMTGKSAKKGLLSGTGPFALAKWNAGDSIQFSAHKAYWQGEPKLQNVVYKFVKNGRAVMAEKGIAHVAIGIAPADQPRLKKNPRLNVKTMSNFIVRSLCVNTAHPILADARVRKALAFAIDRKALCAKFYNGAIEPAYALASPVLAGAGGKKNIIRYNPKLSNKLLDEAGWTKKGADGIRVNASGERLSLTLWTTWKTDIPQIKAYQDYARAIGMELKPRQLNWEMTTTEINKPQGQNRMELVILSWGTTSGDAFGVYWPLLASENMSPAGGNCSFYKNTVVDDLIANALKEPDIKHRQALFDKVEAQLLEDFPRIPLYLLGTYTFAVSKDVKGLFISPLRVLMIDHQTRIE